MKTFENSWAAKSLQPKIPPQERASRKIPLHENPSQQNISENKKPTHNL